MVRRVQPAVFKLLADVPEDKRFWCRDGRVFSNIRALESGLLNMNQETWQHHTGQGHNDFTNWVRDVMGDEKLAADLQKSSTPEAAARAIRDRVARLHKSRRVA